MKKKLLWAPHLYIIVPIFLFLLFPVTFQISFPKEFWILQIYQLGLYLGTFYLNYYVVVPKILFRNTSFAFIIVLSLIVIITATLNYNIAVSYEVDLAMAKFDSAKQNNRVDFLTVNSFMFLVITLFLIFISTTLKVNKRLKDISNRRKELEQEKLSSELAFLKAQINPHFFFNVLHAIYALTETNVEKAQEGLQSLSQMMRYVIYETKHHSSMLSKEIQFIEHYIKLMQLRIPQNTKVVFDKPKSVQDFPVSSMILLPFVENAFKHGITHHKEDEITIHISQDKNILFFKVFNPIAEISTKDLEESTGIGLSNTKRRLDLLYPNQYELKTEKNSENKEFRIFLTLHLV